MTIRPALSESDRERFDSYAALFACESDRGAAVLAGEYLSSLLAELFRAVLVAGKTTDELFGRYAPLSSFSARIDLAFALGLLRDSTRADLHLIRKVRNHFAHHPSSVAFGERPVKDWCFQLRSTQQVRSIFGDEAADFSQDARMQFIMAVQTAMFAINKAKYGAVKFEQPPEIALR